MSTPDIPPGTVLLDTTRSDAENRETLCFTAPERVLAAHTPAEVPPLLKALDAALDGGCWAAGYLAYEAGCAFADVARVPPTELPLAWFGLYRPPDVYPPGVLPWERPNGPSGLHDVRFGIDRTRYLEAIGAIKAHIHAGDVYQINFTDKVHFALEGAPLDLYRRLRRRQPVPYGAFLQVGETSVLSLSPELFFRRNGRRIVARPMKGTVRRGRTLGEDERLRRELAADAKSRAENLMIVDLLRNDLSVCCVPGTVRVPRRFEVEPYETVNQMTSTVEGELREGVGYAELLRALFPCGSVTGAPKRRAMQRIQELERDPRGVYCGAIGYLSPDRRAVFNVAIRTVVVREGRGMMGTGSGVVWDSDAEAEYDECLLKARFLTERQSAQIAPGTVNFKLIETLCAEGGTLPLIDRHVARMQASAAYFGFPFDEAHLLRDLEELAAAGALDPIRRYKVRVTLDRAGCFSMTREPIESVDSAPLRVVVSDLRTDAEDPFFYHKTTHRRVYEEAYRKAFAAGYDEALLLNERGEVTEGTRTNVFIQKGEDLYTPPVESGLLGGIYRQHVLDTHPRAVPRVLTLQDVRTADAFFLCNAVHGLREAVLVPS